MTQPRCLPRVVPALGLGSLLQAQANVLLLAHFDEWQLDADYSAVGVAGGVAGSGARGGELGVFQGAADLGYHTPTAASLSLPARGNVDPRPNGITAPPPQGGWWPGSYSFCLGA